MPNDAPEFITIAEAARICGWKRTNTFREKFMSTEEDAVDVGLRYDSEGHALVRLDSVTAKALEEESTRASRGNWRLTNLKGFVRPRPTADELKKRKKSKKSRRRNTVKTTDR